MHWWLKLISGEQYARWIFVGLGIFAFASAALCASMIVFPAETTRVLHAQPRVSKSLPFDFEGEVVFNSEPGQTPFYELLSSLGESASESICAAQFSFRHPVLFENLRKHAERGVSVELTVSDERREHLLKMLDEQSLPSEGIALIYPLPEPKSHMHHKLWLFDRATACPTAVFGSWNPTEAQEWFDPSFMLRTNDKEVVAIVGKEYDRIASGLSGLRKNEDEHYTPFAAKLTYSNGDLELWQSPGSAHDSLKERILCEIDSAKQSIDLIMWYFNDVDILKALHRQAKSGVHVRILVEDSTFSKCPELVAFSRRDDVEVITDVNRTASVASHPLAEEDFNPYLHQHLAIIDGETVINGSANWTRSGFYRNDELSFFSNIPWLVDEFACQFHALYHEMKKPIAAKK